MLDITFSIRITYYFYEFPVTNYNSIREIAGRKLEGKFSGKCFVRYTFC